MKALRPFMRHESPRKRAAVIEALLVISISILAFSHRLRAQTTFTDDFTSGINFTNWAVRSNQPLYSVSDNFSVQLAKPSGGSFTFQYVGLALMYAAQGNFDVSVDFTNASIALASGSPGNQVQLNTRFGGQHFLVVRSSEVIIGQNAHVYIDPPSSLQGTRSWTSSFGTLRVVRTNAHVQGFIDGTLLYESDYNTNDATFSFTLQNNGTTDATSVVFDNFQITADNLVRLPPEPQIQLLSQTNAVISWADRSWPEPMGGFVVLSTTNLSGSNIWQTNSAFFVPSSLHSFTNNLGGNAKFYRLMQGH